MATNLGKKYDCYSCHTKFYDLGKPEPLCPKCGANQKDAEDSAPAPSRSRRVVEVPVEEDFGEEAETPAAVPDEDEEEGIVEPVEEESDDDDDDEEE